MDSMRIAPLTEALERLFEGNVSIARRGHLPIALLHGPAVRVTTTLEAGGDVVRIYVSRIVHAVPFERKDDVDHVLAIVQAIQDGGAVEYLRVTSSGIAYAGYSIKGRDFRYDTAAVDSTELHSLPV